MSPSIKIDSLEVVDRSCLKIGVTFSRDLDRLFRGRCFSIEYGEDVSHVKADVLAVPALAGLVGVAWLSQSTVDVDCLDEDYYYSLLELLRYFRTLYPGLDLRARINADLVRNSGAATGVGLLFSGGVDSLYSYYSNAGLRPDLFTVFGSEIPHERKGFINSVKDVHRTFAEKHGLRVHFITTDYRDFVNGEYLGFKYHDYLKGYSYYEAFCLSIFLTGLCAPLTSDRMSRLIISSGGGEETNIGYCSSPLIDEKIRHAGLRVVHEGAGVTRSEKIRYLSGYIRGEENIVLRVCNYAPKYLDALNCSRCEKCYRNMLLLLVNGLNPGRFGFEYAPKTLSRLKERITSGGFLKEDDLPFWKVIQENAVAVTPDKPLEEFIEWLRGHDLEKCTQKNRGVNRAFLSAYQVLPKKVRTLVRILYYKRKIVV